MEKYSALDTAHNALTSAIGGIQAYEAEKGVGSSEIHDHLNLAKTCALVSIAESLKALADER